MVRYKNTDWRYTHQIHVVAAYEELRRRLKQGMEEMLHFFYRILINLDRRSYIYLIFL